MWQFVGLLGGLGGRFGAIMYKPLPPLEEFKKVFEYNPDTGEFIWLIGARKGKIAGSKSGEYWSIEYKPLGRFKAHRVAWLFIYGEDPGNDKIDHKDTNGLNNAKTNLRKADNKQNGANQKISSNNSSGVKGVCWDKQKQKWRARINSGGKSIWCELFDDLQEASEKISAKRKELQGEFARDY